MKIENQSELEKLIKMLRKTGVETFKFGEIELKLSPDVPESNYKKKGKSSADRPDHELSPEEKMQEEQKILFWSSTPPGLEEDKEN